MMDGQRGSSTVPDQDVFVAEFRRWRDVRGLSRLALARQMGYSRSYVSKVIIETGDETDEQYEGCLSFFDVRCLVGRSLVIHVEHQDITGDRRITIFERGVARLVAHEIDHLHGILCRDHLSAGLQPIPVEQYRGTGTSWHYHENGAIR